MTIEEARKAIIEFTEKYRGQIVYFDDIPEADKYAWLLTYGYFYYRNTFWLTEVLRRSINLANNLITKYSGENEWLKVQDLGSTILRGY